jgi:hypothetical protein
MLFQDQEAEYFFTLPTSFRWFADPLTGTVRTIYRVHVDCSGNKKITQHSFMDMNAKNTQICFANVLCNAFQAYKIFDVL